MINLSFRGTWTLMPLFLEKQQLMSVKPPERMWTDLLVNCFCWQQSHRNECRMTYWVAAIGGGEANRKNVHRTMRQQQGLAVKSVKEIRPDLTDRNGNKSARTNADQDRPTNKQLSVVARPIKRTRTDLLVNSRW